MKPWSHDWLIAAGAYPGFCSMKRLGVFLLALDSMLVHRRSLPHNFLGFPYKSSVPFYTPGWREAVWELSVLPKNTTQCPRWGLEPGPLNPESSALTMRPPRLHVLILAPRVFLRFSGILPSTKINPSKFQLDLLLFLWLLLLLLLWQKPFEEINKGFNPI